MLYICGCNNNFQLGEKSNNASPSGFKAISPPVQSKLDLSSVLSYSIYSDHSVIITSDKKAAEAIGCNEDCRISGSLPKTDLDHYTEISLKDSKGQPCFPISVVCGELYTLYMVTTSDSNDQFSLLFSYDGIESQFPLFLNIGNSKPVALFGGRLNSAAIDSEGAILFVPELIYDTPSLPIVPTFLPGKEKCVSLSVCDDFLIALSLSGRLFEAVTTETDKLTFSEVSGLGEVIQISGTFNHCLAVTKDGRVFGKGSNKGGKLGLGKNVEEVKEFVEIVKLRDKNIKNVFAGRVHSLFLNDEGKIFACGTNEFGHLMTSDGVTEYSIFEPIETTIKSGASFCIAGDSVSAVFLNCQPPKNCPNQKII